MCYATEGHSKSSCCKGQPDTADLNLAFSKVLEPHASRDIEFDLFLCNAFKQLVLENQADAKRKVNSCCSKAESTQKDIASEIKAVVNVAKQSILCSAEYPAEHKSRHHMQESFSVQKRLTGTGVYLQACTSAGGELRRELSHEILEFASMAWELLPVHHRS